MFYDLGILNEYGLKGLSKDTTLAAQWYKLSSDLHHPKGMASYGRFLLDGRGSVTKNVVHGSVLMSRAACEGSEVACYYLGLCYLRGRHGFPKDIEHTRYYWKKVADGSCKYKHLNAPNRDVAKKWIRDNA